MSCSQLISSLLNPNGHRLSFKRRKPLTVNNDATMTGWFFAALLPLLSWWHSVHAQDHIRKCILIRDTAREQDILLQTWGDDAVRVRAIDSKGGAFRDDVVSALQADAEESSHPIDYYQLCNLVSLTDYPTRGFSLYSGNLQVNLGPDGRLQFINVARQTILWQEVRPRQLIPAPSSPPLPNTTFWNATLIVDAPSDERLYGLGQHKTGVLNYRTLAPPHNFSLAPQNTEILIPVIHSSRGYVYLCNLPSLGNVTLHHDRVEWTFASVWQLDLWVATTSADETANPWAQLQERYTEATGRVPVYPYWATGFWQSKNRYRNQAQVLQVARQHVARQIPLSLIIIDYLTWKYPNTTTIHLGDQALPTECWPDPAGMVRTLAAQGIHVMLSPYFHSLSNRSKYFAKARDGHFLATNGTGHPIFAGYDEAYLYDVFQPEARAYAWQAVQKGYIQNDNLQLWWMDCDEPCGSEDVNVSEPILHSLLYNRGQWPASLVGAAYPHMVNRMVSEGRQRTSTTDSQDIPVVMLARSAWAGSQRYGTAIWSGDTQSNFTNLREQFVAGLNMAMSGIPYWTTDIGGYSHGDISDPLFRQLVVRWFQWGAFCPLFRNHGRRLDSRVAPEPWDHPCGETHGSNEIWNFGVEAEAAIVRVMRIREQLRPYIHSLYQAAAATGAPVIRPLFYDFWQDAEAAWVEDQFMLGPDYLVAPQLWENATQRSVYLPPLTKDEVWVDFFAGDVYEVNDDDDDDDDKGLWIVVPTPLDTFPLFARQKATEGGGNRKRAPLEVPYSIDARSK